MKTATFLCAIASVVDAARVMEEPILHAPEDSPRSAPAKERQPYNIQRLRPAGSGSGVLTINRNETYYNLQQWGANFESLSPNGTDNAPFEVGHVDSNDEDSFSEEEMYNGDFGGGKLQVVDSTEYEMIKKKREAQSKMKLPQTPTAPEETSYQTPTAPEKTSCQTSTEFEEIPQPTPTAPEETSCQTPTAPEETSCQTPTASETQSKDARNVLVLDSEETESTEAGDKSTSVAAEQSLPQAVVQKCTTKPNNSLSGTAFASVQAVSSDLPFEEFYSIAVRPQGNVASVTGNTLASKSIEIVITRKKPIKYRNDIRIEMTLKRDAKSAVFGAFVDPAAGATLTTKGSTVSLNFRDNGSLPAIVAYISQVGVVTDAKVEKETGEVILSTSVSTKHARIAEAAKSLHPATRMQFFSVPSPITEIYRRINSRLVAKVASSEEIEKMVIAASTLEFSKMMRAKDEGEEVRSMAYLGGTNIFFKAMLDRIKLDENEGTLGLAMELMQMVFEFN